MKCRRFRCPACGWFGRKARRRAEDAEAASHIAWAASLLAPRPTTIRVPGVSLTLHTHDPETVECRGEASGCRTFPAEDSIITTFPTPTRETYEHWDRLFRSDLRDALAEARADEIAEVVGPLSYEEQSEMFGDPIADVIRKETE
ncbi:hypothetical protein SEA_DONNY_94 [Mycobacterium phage Donny]|uniref:Uncharacterized protein n=3 Tax=Acadianvirus acadian TaxID=1982901 RepID=A0A7M1CMV8_9CAUD|nr:hypothetical protein CM14_gp94 [Mycobacterium phage Acadian]AER49007.1 hypothetical protein ACADIAN_94 [Mycobacterium phage Acadian]QBI96452.1 hypothetical protein SEA_DONNY_94 [Mycobacterium phage Donny]QOP65636.1 hypothetical protein SEA_SUIGENERIS_95 [Mycobacterium phage Suigeneris]WUT94864.1 hypothetical protein PRODRIGUEZ_94 [Mycobacterium phage PRodriguez]